MKWLHALLRRIDRLMAALYPETPTVPVTVPTSPPEPVKPPVEPTRISKREMLYATSKASLGVDLTPLDEVPDRVACVAQLQAVFHKATGTYIGKGAARSNTLSFLLAIRTDARFKAIPLDEAEHGDVAIAATGQGADPADRGHCWIVGKTHWMSNTSRTGTWEANYTKQAVVDDFTMKRGFPLHVFRYA